MSLSPRLLILSSLCLSLTTGSADTVALPYTVKHEGQVSLAVYDQQGRLVRTLLTGAPRQPGQYAEAWDGCDRYGNPQPPGKYTWKLLETKGLTAEFLLEVGQNPTPKDARSVGNHGAPGSVAADETGVYFIASSEGAHAFGKTDRDGKYLYVRDPGIVNWGAHRGFAITLLDRKLYDLCSDGLTHGYDAVTGHGFTDDDSGTKPWNLNWPGVTNTVTGAMDLAADPTNKLLVVSYRDQNGLRWFDPAQKGKLVDELTGLDHPAGVAVKADGTVLVIAKGAVWSVTRADKTPRPVIPADKLQSPWRLDVNRQTGEILVAENSDAASGILPLAAGGFAPPVAGVVAPRHHQVKKFSPTGNPLATYGRPEGRRDGPYIPTDFRNINDVTFDPLGGFFVCEGPFTPPRRTVRFDDSGKVLHEWFGGQAYGTLCVPEPGDPTHVWFYGNAPKASGLIRCEIDFATKTWRVVETYSDVFLDNVLGNITPNFLQITPRNGKLYLWSGTPRALSIAVYDPKAKTLRPSNASLFQPGLPRDLVPAGFRGERDSYIWNDLNDDGQATADELVWMHRPLVGGYIDPADFTLYLVGDACASEPGFKITPRRLTAGGTPVYDWADAKPAPADWKESDLTARIGDLQHNPDGTWLGCSSTFIFSPWGWETHGKWYFNSCSGIDRLIKWDKNWKPIWSVGRHSPDAEHDVGSTAMARYLSGTTHGCVVWTDASDEETAGPTVWTDDGLYVDELWRLHGTTASEDVYGIATINEYPSGRLYTDSKTGRVYLYMITCANGSTVYEIHGWDGWRHDHGTFELKRPQPAALSFTGTGLKAEYFNNLDRTAPPALTRTDSPVYFLWGTNAVAPEVHADNFSVRWSGLVQPPTTEPYKFSVETFQYWICDGPAKFLRLWVDGRKLIDTAETLDDQWILLKAGTKYDIRIEAGWGAGNTVAKLCWETKTNERRVIPPQFLYPSASGTGVSPVPTGSSASLWFRAKHNGDILPGRLALQHGDLVAIAGKDRLAARGQYADGQWHQVVQVSGGPDEDQRLYVDGILRAVGRQQPEDGRGGTRPSTGGFGGTASTPSLSDHRGSVEIRDAHRFDRALHALEIEDSLYRREVGLLAHISFDDGQGIHPAIQGAVPGLTVNLVGETAWTKQGRIAGALTTKPNGPLQPSYIMIGNPLKLPATDYTIAFWFKSTEVTGVLFCAKRRSPYNASWTDHNLLLSGGQLNFVLSGQEAIVTPGAMNDGQWHQVVTTVGGATKDSRLYVDGKRIGTGKLAAREFVSNRLGVNLGGPIYGYPGAAATFDDFRCYSRALTEDEIQALAIP